MIDWKNIKDKFVVLRSGNIYKVISYTYSPNIKYRHGLSLANNFVFDCEKFLPIDRNSCSASFLDDGHFLNETENKTDIIEVKEYTLPTRVEFVPEVNDVLVSFMQTNLVVLARKIYFDLSDYCLNVAVTEQNKPLSPFRVLQMNPKTGKLFGGQRIIEVIRNNEKIYRYDSKPETFGMF